MGIVSFFRKKKSTAQVDSAVRNIYLTLIKFQRSHSLVQVRFKGDDTVYQSIILEVVPEHGHLTIDELFPKQSGLQGLVGHEIEIFVKESGYTLSFMSSILEREEADQNPFYRIELPKVIDRQQRRGAFRIVPDSREDMSLTIVDEDEKELVMVRDLSSSGICIVLDGDRRDDFKVGTVINYILLNYGAGETVKCQLDVRNVRLENEPFHQTVIGAKFLHINPEDQKQLEQYLLRLQREQRRKASAVA